MRKESLVFHLIKLCLWYCNYFCDTDCMDGCSTHVAESDYIMNTCPAVLACRAAQTSLLPPKPSAAAAAHLMCEWPLQWKDVNNMGGHSFMELRSSLPSPCISQWHLLAFAVTILWAILSLGQQDYRPPQFLKYTSLDLHTKSHTMGSLL